MKSALKMLFCMVVCMVNGVAGLLVVMACASAGIGLLGGVVAVGMAVTVGWILGDLW